MSNSSHTTGPPDLLSNDTNYVDKTSMPYNTSTLFAVNSRSGYIISFSTVLIAVVLSVVILSIILISFITAIIVAMVKKKERVYHSGGEREMDDSFHFEQNEAYMSHCEVTQNADYHSFQMNDSGAQMATPSLSCSSTIDTQYDYCML